MNLRSLILLYFVSISTCWCQDSRFVLQPAMFDKITDEIVLSDNVGWIFRKGNNTSWAGKEIDVTGWTKLNPQQVYADMADESGKVEGWFRLKFGTDSLFHKKVRGVRVSTWAAIDLYIDGNRIFSGGNTGANGEPYQEYRRKSIDAIPIELEPGEHWIAIHLVDYTSPIFLNRLKSELPGSTVIRLSGSGYHPYSIDFIREVTVYSTLWVCVGTTLSLLFWIMALVTPFEKRLILIASCVTCLTLSILFITYSNSAFGISFETFMIFYYATNIAMGGYIILTAIIVATTVQRQISKWLVAILALIVAIGFVENLFPGTIGPLGTLLFMLLCAYYTIVSWKSLNGAQWAIVVGLLVTAVWLVVYLVGYLMYRRLLYPVSLLYMTGFALSFPFSLLIYLAIRFQENIKDIQTNAQQVILLLEEKKEQAVTQKQVLEEEVARQTVELRTSLENLKSTQAQLIQSEKMASLGELTAGIAHEIQNPLNFVNNFSEVSNELIVELNTELESGRPQLATEIANDIKKNLEKINYHGKRADAIVKGMLQHSRTSSGQKEPTNINALCDEYLRLSYHGLRAKDKSFNAKLETNFDPSIEKLNVVPQDIGRVILNLINNAFYAVSEKQKQNIPGYEPTVSVSTNKQSARPDDPVGRDKILISIKDNGHGIPESNKEKIFQPFFTTKPTGQGTGLGLSLSYDIIKAHGGELRVETKEGEGAEFIIQLPV